VFIAIGRRRYSMNLRFRHLAVAMALVTAFAAYGEFRKTVVTEGELTVQAQTVLRTLNYTFGNHENVLFLIERPGYDLAYGKTLLAAATVFIPRSIWPDKPIGAGPMMKNTVTPGSY